MPAWRPDDASRADLDARLANAAAALGIELGAGQRRQLLDYLDQLNRWNAAYNLTAVRDPGQQLVLHLVDCLAVVGPLAPWLPQGGRVVDVGSGAGLPGVVLAVCRPDVSVHCIDAVGKKAAFVQQLRATLALPNLQAHHRRLERGGSPDPLGADVVIARAFASLADFVELARRLRRADGGIWAAMKAQPPLDEVAALAALDPPVAVTHTLPLHVPGLDAPRCLLVIEPVGDRQVESGAQLRSWA